MSTHPQPLPAQTTLSLLQVSDTRKHRLLAHIELEQSHSADTWAFGLDLFRNQARFQVEDIYETVYCMKPHQRSSRRVLSASHTTGSL